ncbi:hypothetical protein Tco_1516394 [Tanacetum coccineum]
MLFRIQDSEYIMTEGIENVNNGKSDKVYNCKRIGVIMLGTSTFRPRRKDGCLSSPNSAIIASKGRRGI